MLFSFTNPPRTANMEGDADRKLKAHTFKKVYFSKLTWCNLCKNFIWGVHKKQGYKCSGASNYPKIPFNLLNPLLYPCSFRTIFRCSLSDAIVPLFENRAQYCLHPNYLQIVGQRSTRLASLHAVNLERYVVKWT